MKKLVILIFVIILTACGHDSPKFNDFNDPFVVDKIEHYAGNLSLYTSRVSKGNVDNYFWKGTACIALPTGMYNIGDTIIIKK